MAESRAYVSEDLLHSNAFVQHVNTDTIRHYQRAFHASGTPLESVHIWLRPEPKRASDRIRCETRS